MSANLYKPHLTILPEDSANAEIANGFLLGLPTNTRQIEVLRVAGGWEYVIRRFESDQVQKMRHYLERRVVLLLDFDNHINERMQRINQIIPADLANRTYVFGSASTPEKLKVDCGRKFENVGLKLANECELDFSELWLHKDLAHNQIERARLRLDLSSTLFSSADTN